MTLVRSAVLEARGLRKVYRRGPEEIHALRDVDVSIAPGEVVALVGPSGSGKTTLLNALVGWEPVDAGRLAWAGDGLGEGAGGLAWSELAIVPQSLGLMRELSVRENVLLAVKLDRGRGAEERAAQGRAADLLELLGLTDVADRLPSETSLGEQQRAALGRALVLGPRLLLADEPTSHQDGAWTKGVLSALRHASEGGTACLLATHHRATVRYADRVLAIRDGRVEEVDPADLTLQEDDL